MAVILDISTAVPEHAISKENLLKFYEQALDASGLPPVSKKLSILLQKTKISSRYSCIPDFDGKEHELFTGNNYDQPAERRMEIFKEKSLPLAIKAIDPLLAQNHIDPADITHLITVSCTGVFAPGLEFMIADHYGLQHTEKLAINFLGCYAGIKAIKHAHYIAKANPGACVLIASVELCSIHFVPSVTDEDIVANLLFADGAAALLVCGSESRHIKNKPVLNIDSIGSACIPDSADLMTWDISQSAFRMYLSKELVKTIRENIEPVINSFLMDGRPDPDYWAIHPGGVRIVEAVKQSLQLTDNNVEDSMKVLMDHGNMSSPTVLFILKRILNRIRNSEPMNSKNIFACAFGPGLTVEMLQLSSVNASHLNHSKRSITNYAIPV